MAALAPRSLQTTLRGRILTPGIGALWPVVDWFPAVSNPKPIPRGLVASTPLLRRPSPLHRDRTWGQGRRDCP
jgi:hypothetical protein